MLKACRIICLTISLVSIGAHADALQFNLNSKDGYSRISGQIDTPSCLKAAYPSVLMVGGTGLFSRNVYFGRSHTERDLLFLDLAKKLNHLCIATIRFDYRGISCDLMSKGDLASCVDQKMRATVTDQTILDDIQVVYDFVLTQPSIDKTKLVLLGHSEGSLNISRLIARKTVEAKAIVFFGGITESAKGILHWQISERPAAWARALDLDQNGILTNDEIKSGFSNSPLNGSYSIESLISPTGSWTYAEIEKGFEDIYKAAASDALSHNKSDPYFQSNIIFAAYQWWQRWFTDDVSVLENLKEFSGPIEYHNGDFDSQAPGTREQSILQSSTVSMKSKPTFVLHSGKGHGLSNDPLYGPIDEGIALSIVDKINFWVN